MLLDLFELADHVVPAAQRVHEIAAPVRVRGEAAQEQIDRPQIDAILSIAGPLLAVTKITPNPIDSPQRELPRQARKCRKLPHLSQGRERKDESRGGPVIDLAALDDPANA